MKKGFTLVELLAVIVILGIISTITYGVVIGNIETTRKKSFESSAKIALEAAKEYVIANYEENDFPPGGIDITNDELELKNDNFISGVIMRNEDGAIEVVNLTDGTYCANGLKSDMEITDGSCEASDTSLPEVDVKVLETNLNEIVLMVKMQDAQSGIKEADYCYVTETEEKLKEKKCQSIEVNNERELLKRVINLSDLKENKNYEIVFSVTNNSGKTETETTKVTINVKTTEISEPTFSITSDTYTSSKIVTITYPKTTGYVYKYGTTEPLTTLEEGYEKKLEVIDNTTVTAAIYKNEDKEPIVSVELNVTGIDNTPPTSSVAIENEGDWAKSKKVTVTSTDDEGTGLALRAYSYDGGSSWVKENVKEYILNQTMKVRTRDKLGNINNKFTINGKEYEEYTFTKIDTIGPKIDIKVTEGNKKEETNEWYISNKVGVTLTITDQVKQLVNGELETVNGGSGINELVPVITVNNVVVPFTTISSGKYFLYISNNGISVIKATMKDKLGNETEESLTIKKDDVVPTVVPKANPTNYTSTDSNKLISDYFNITVGVSGQKEVNCTANLLPVTYISDLGTNTSKTVVCTVTNNALVSGSSNTSGIVFRYYYTATAVYGTCYGTRTETYGCVVGEDSICTKTGINGGCSWSTWYHWKDDGCSRNVSYSYSCFKYYSCPSGGSASGTICYC